MLQIRDDYAERVYAGVLGKIIGVYLGRPFEGWSYERIMRELGEIQYYVHDKLGKPLIVVDDDISGTFAFVRAMADYGNSLDITSKQIGQTWLNYLIEGRTVLWWGGMGMSTEHTAYLRLKHGISAPESGSMALNGKIVAEQIGAQIFIDGWAMISPGDPERAADLARRAGSVSHDGEAIYGAQVLAAMEAQAFIESDIQRLLDVGVSVIPQDSVIYRMIADLRAWRAQYSDWHDAFAQIVEHYGYDRYGGNCHMVPNHALIILALLYGEGDFQKSLSIVNTTGWDTDCNSGNLGCLMGIRGGLAGLDTGPDWRTPVADRLYIPTADGGRCVSDAATEALRIVEMGRAQAGQAYHAPKDGAKYHFELTGAVQGFVTDESIECRGTTRLENVAGHSELGTRALCIRYEGLATGRVSRAWRETLPDYDAAGAYQVTACPTLYPGQLVCARVTADPANQGQVYVCLAAKAYGADDKLFTVRSTPKQLEVGEEAILEWLVDVPVGCPIAWVGLELGSERRTDGAVYLDWLTWQGTPAITFGKPAHNGMRWLSTWVQATSELRHSAEGQTYWPIQNEGTGLIIQGSADWQDYAVSAVCKPHMVRSFGVAACVQGLKRYYALELVQGGKAQLVRELDGTHVLAESPYEWELYQPYALEIARVGNAITAKVNGQILFKVEDESPLRSGAIALLIEEGRMGVNDVSVHPLAGRSTTC